MNSIITFDPNVCNGKSRIRGLSYPVENVLEWWSAGMTLNKILFDYEDLTIKDIFDALAFKRPTTLSQGSL